MEPKYVLVLVRDFPFFNGTHRHLVRHLAYGTLMERDAHKSNPFFVASFG